MTLEELAAALRSWADEAEAEAATALGEDRLGRFARLRGTAHGFRVAAAELSLVRGGKAP